MPLPFVIKDCTLSTLSLGESASSLPEFRDKLMTVPEASIYYHFWGNRLRFTLEEPEYLNDFAKWARFSLQDRVLAEKLAIIDPTECSTLEILRQNVLEIVEEHLDALDLIVWKKLDYKFHFMSSIMVVFQTNMQATNIKELVNILPFISLGSVFYHFIDARRRTPHNEDDFSGWLRELSLPEEFLNEIHALDPYLLSLSAIKEKVQGILKRYL